MEGKAAVIGSADFVVPFSALGLDIYPVEPDTEQVGECAKRILDAKYSLVVVAENIARNTDEVFGKTLKKSLPCVVVVPFTMEPEGFAMESLGKLLKMATGIDFMNN